MSAGLTDGCRYSREGGRHMGHLVFIGELEAYREQAENSRKKQYQRLLREADRYEHMELPAIHPKESTTYMGIAIVNLALAFCLSREERYLRNAKRFINTVLSYEKWGNAHLVNVDLSASWILFGLSLGYDWLKPYLCEEERKTISDKLRCHAGIIYDYRRETYGSGWSTNFYQNHNWINMTGLAAAGYVLEGEDERAAAYRETAKENFSRVFSYLADDGSNYEGVTYWRYGGMWLFVYAHLLKTEEGIDYFKTSEYLKKTFYYRLYQSCGDLNQQLNFGDCHDRHSSHTVCVYYKTAAEYGDGFAQTYGNLVLDEFLEEEARESKVKPGILPEAAFEFLWYDPKVLERDLSELPLVRYFEDLGLLSIRENWGRDSKVLTIKCGYPGGKKQWKNGWRLLREEAIDCLSLSHHHPDNLAYIFARGSQYLTCEDGYNRNIMPAHHNVILVDGEYTDAVDCNDVYMTSAKLRLEKESSRQVEQEYFGQVKVFRQDGSAVIYQADNTGIYPKKLHMKEVSRLLFTDGLTFWVFVDICRSEIPHTYCLISNTDMDGEQVGNGCFRYGMESGDITYTVFSDKAIQSRQYEQEVVSIMTSQEPDKVCRSEIHTLAMESSLAVKEQIFFECFTFRDSDAQVFWENGVMKVETGSRRYSFAAARRQTETEDGSFRVQITIRDGQGTELWYEI